MLEKIKKRDGRIVRFNLEKINDVVIKVFIVLGKDLKFVDEVIIGVLNKVDSKFKK